MAKPSAFRDFIALLKKDWRETFPSIRPIEQSFPPLMLQASTFYAGLAQSSRMHVFLTFQHSSLSWKVGRFTINVTLSERMGLPQGLAGPSLPNGNPIAEGSYRIGSLLGGSDKWWHLKEYPPPIFETLPVINLPGAWRPTSYGDYDLVLREAVDDVNRDVEAVLRMLGAVADAP
jgi:hypothetical protein